MADVSGVQVGLIGENSVYFIPADKLSFHVATWSAMTANTSTTRVISMRTNDIRSELVQIYISSYQFRAHVVKLVNITAMYVIMCYVCANAIQLQLYRVIDIAIDRPVTKVSMVSRDNSMLYSISDSPSIRLAFQVSVQYKLAIQIRLSLFLQIA